MNRLADLLHSFGEQATVNIRLVGVSGTRIWHLKLEPEQTMAVEGAVENPALELIMRPTTWTEIATGSLSPLLAFGSGRMRVRGDVGLAKRLLKYVASSSDAIVDIC
jgi:putative sterol carrier protein